MALNPYIQLDNGSELLVFSNVRAFCFAIVLYNKTPYGGPEGPCQTHVYNFNIFKLTFSELDVSNLAKLDISTHIHVGFVSLLAWIVLTIKLWPGLLRAPTLSLNPGGPYMHWPMYCHSWAWPG